MTEEKDDKDMTMEEREQWLRDRGVLIENPNENKAADGVITINEQLADPSKLDTGIEFVYVPQDESQPLQTVRLPLEVAQQGGDAIPAYVKSHFADSKAIDATLVQQQAQKHFAGGQLEGHQTTISASAMQAVAAQGSVETFPLVRPAASNDSQGVYIYLDEVGLLKKLPSNPRATQFAVRCGYHPPPQFYGNVFVGRVCTKPTLRNVPFQVGIDTDPAAEWWQRAAAENVAWQQEMNRVTQKEGMSQPAHVGTEGTSVQEDTFTWTQEDDDIEITVKLDDKVVDKKKVQVKFLSKKITVVYGGEPKLLLPLYAAIDVDACTWTMEGSNKLVITCEKANPGELWPRVKA